MKNNVVAPSVGESITEVSILKWAKPNGALVKTGELLLEIESDKATVEIVAEYSGVLTILKLAGERIPVGEVIGQIDDSAAAAAKAGASPGTETGTGLRKAPGAAQSATGYGTSAPPATAAPLPGKTPQPGPAARKALAESGTQATGIRGSGKDGRITKGDILDQASTSGTGTGTGTMLASPSTAAPAPATARPAQAMPSPRIADKPGDRRVPMTMLRAKIAERLVQAQHTAAILTTFNEVDMSPVMKLRNQHKEAFKAKHGVALSFMSFFTRGVIEALKAIPEVNASIDGRDVIYHDYYDIGIAVGTERGLVVPVLRDARKMSFVDVEKKIAELAVKARDGKLSIAELSGGTFTISNGGVYGSLLSTPILNPPQSGILGMHKIQDRPVAIDGKLEVRPMMYLALSYDHRIIDGKGAVTFLVTLRDFLEHPERLGLEY